jgi:hemerythrin
MLASGFEDYARHKHQHALFVQKAVNLAQEFEAGRADLLSTLLPFLSRWMGHHITHEDRRLGPHLNARRS